MAELLRVNAMRWNTPPRVVMLRTGCCYNAISYRNVGLPLNLNVLNG